MSHKLKWNIYIHLACTYIGVGEQLVQRNREITKKEIDKVIQSIVTKVPRTASPSLGIMSEVGELNIYITQKTRMTADTLPHLNLIWPLSKFYPYKCLLWLGFYKSYKHIYQLINSTNFHPLLYSSLPLSMWLLLICLTDDQPRLYVLYSIQLFLSSDIYFAPC